MKALKILLDERKQQLDIFEQNKELGNPNESNYIVLLNEAIKELEDLQNENKSLVKTLEKYNEEMIDLRKENQDLKNSNNELLKGLKSTQKRLEEWLEKCK